MPKMSERERLADLEARQRKMATEIEDARRALRGKYGQVVVQMPVETVGERDFREAIAQLIRVGGPAAVTAMKALPAAAS